MKNILVGLMSLLVVNCYSQNINFLDSNLKQAILDQYGPQIDLNTDSEISISEAGGANVTQLSISKKGIVDLTGLEYFLNVTALYLDNNNIDSAVIQLPKLQELYVYDNGMTFLSVQACPQLRTLMAYNNLLTSIDLSQNSKLEQLWIGNNKLTELDFSLNGSFKVLIADSNELSKINIAACPEFTGLIANENLLYDIDLRSNPLLKGSSVNLENNPLKMVCATVDQLTDLSNWTIPTGAIYSQTCDTNDLKSIVFLDNNFKQALLNYSPAIDTSGNGEIEVQEALAVNTLFLSGKNISSMDEIHYFENLSNFNCGNNSLSNLDLSKNSKLNFFVGYNNNIDSLDLSLNSLLVTVDVALNNMEHLKLGTHPHLNNINCSNNLLNNIALAGVPVLRTFQGNFNKFTSLDFSASPVELQTVNLNDNLFETINLKLNKRVLSYGLNVDNNPLKMICVDSVHLSIANTWNYPSPAQLSLNCDTNEFKYIVFQDLNFEQALLQQTPTIDLNADGKISVSEALKTAEISVDGKNISSIKEIGYFKNLERLSCLNNSIDSISMLSHLKLKFLFASNNSLTYLNVENCPALNSLSCVSNQLTTIDVSNNVKLKDFWCMFNELTHIDVTNNPDLEVLVAEHNQLKKIDVTANLKLNSLHIRDNQIQQLDLRNNKLIIAYDAALDSNPLTLVCIDSIQVAHTSTWNPPLSAYFSLDCTVDTSQIIYFPDTLFKHYLINWARVKRISTSAMNKYEIDHNKDGEISMLEASDIFSIEIGGYSSGFDTLNWFSDIKGIEAFQSLEVLGVFKAKVQNFNLENLASLKLLTISNNPAQNVQVKDLSVLEALAIMKNSTLKDVTIENLPSLKSLTINENNLQNLDVSGFGKLETLDCYGNNIDRLCVSKNRIDSLVITKDNSTVLDTLCGQNTIYFPDVNLRNAVLSYTPSIDLNGDSVITYEEVLAIDSLNLSGKNIAILTGLEAFKNLKKLNVSFNSLNFLDVSQLQYLTSLIASNNQIKTLVVFTGIPNSTAKTMALDNQSLTELDVSYNDFNDLDISNIVNLETVDVSMNPQLASVCVNSKQLADKVDGWVKDNGTAWGNTSCLRVTAMNESYLNQVYTAYPNPAETELFVNSNNVSLYDITGVPVPIIWNSTGVINVTNLPRGMYILKYINGSAEKIVLR